MGTWNATCAVTQLPIKENERVVMIPLICKTVDHLARDNISGAGSVENDLLAQPLSIPLRGTYNGVGGIEPQDNDPGLKFMHHCLAALVKEQRLFDIDNGEPVLCTSVPEDALELLTRGNLLVHTKNPRRAWLKKLKDLYDSTEDKKGLAHYEPQLRVDINTVPEFLEMPLSLNLVPEALYDNIVVTSGLGESLDVWNEEKNEPIEFKGTFQEQLEAELTLSPEDIKKVAAIRTAWSPQTMDLLGVPVEPQKDNEAVEMLLQFVLKNQKKWMYDMCGKRYFSPHGIMPAFSSAVLDNDEGAKKAILKFELFGTAMQEMRKQWVPQTGAGSSHGIGEGSTKALYEEVAKFMMASVAPEQAPGI